MDFLIQAFHEPSFSRFSVHVPEKGGDVRICRILAALAVQEHPGLFVF